MENLIKVLLEDGTVGILDTDTIDSAAENFIGEEIDVHLHDENEFLIKVSGILKEIL